MRMTLLLRLVVPLAGVLIAYGGFHTEGFLFIALGGFVALATGLILLTGILLAAFGG